MTEMEKVPRDTLWRWIWIVTFAIAFAWVEVSVVAYLRDIYYPGGFKFPISVQWDAMRLVIDHLSIIELGREIATILMLVAVACIAGKNTWQKFCFFMIVFGVWDIFYYAWLWVALRWPESLMTWDILFLLPLPWTGPVITPILIALAMTTAGSVIIYLDERGVKIRTRPLDWIVVLGCGLLMITAFCWDWKNIIQLPGDPRRTGVPNRFAWWLYLPAYFTSIIYTARKLGSVWK